MNENKKSPQVGETTGEDIEVKMLLRVIEQGVHSILIRDVYIRALLIIQVLLTLFLLLK